MPRRPRLTTAYCPYCLRGVRKRSHQRCSRCKYETGGIESWRTLEELIAGDTNDLPYSDVSLGAWTRLVARAVLDDPDRAHEALSNVNPI